MKEFLQNIHSQFSWMNLQTITLIGSFIATVIMGFIVIPILKKMKIGQVVRDDGRASKKDGHSNNGRNNNLDSKCTCSTYSWSSLS